MTNEGERGLELNDIGAKQGQHPLSPRPVLASLDTFHHIRLLEFRYIPYYRKLNAGSMKLTGSVKIRANLSRVNFVER